MTTQATSPIPVSGPTATAPGAFRHEALVYRGPREFLDGTVDFVRGGLAAGEPVLVAVIPPKLSLLRGALGADARHVAFVDMAELGRNPARIIPAWHDFLDAHRDRAGARGVGEPIWAGRRPVEIAEAQLHESLLNTAFDGGRGWLLRCPYDADALDPAVVAAAAGTHPHVLDAGGGRRPGAVRPVRDLDGSLAEPAVPTRETPFDLTDLSAVHEAVTVAATAFGLGPGRRADLLLAAHEIATNSLVHGGGARLPAHVVRGRRARLRDQGRRPRRRGPRRPAPPVHRAGGRAGRLARQPALRPGADPLDGRADRRTPVRLALTRRW